MDPAFEMHHLNSWKTYSDGGGGLYWQFCEFIWSEIQIIKQSYSQKVNTDLFKTVILESATTTHEYKPLCIIVWYLRDEK